MPSNPVSLRLSDRAAEIIEEAKEHLGLNRSAATEQALRHWALTGPLAEAKRIAERPKKKSGKTT